MNRPSRNWRVASGDRQARKTVACMFIVAVTPILMALDCQPVEEICIGSPCSSQCFNVDTFASEIESQLDGKTTGWAYVITYKEDVQKIGSGGYARTSADAPEELFSPFTRMNIASVSKSLTTIAAIKALDAAGADLDDTILPWLPSTWTAGPHISGITFRELLTHTSGFRSSDDNPGVRYEELRQWVADGISLADKSTPKYENGNFCMFRVLIPYLDGLNPSSNVESDDSQMNILTRTHYIDYMRQHVFEPLQIYGADAQAEENPTLLYAFPHNGNKGWNTGDERDVVGGGAWVLSAAEIAKIVSALKHSTTLLTSQQRDSMFNGNLGCYEFSHWSGTAYHHNGGLTYWGGPYNESYPAGLRTVYYIFPNDVQAVVFHNSQEGGVKWINSIVEDAYTAAWSNPNLFEGPPSVTITEPANGATLYVGVPYAFASQIFDPQTPSFDCQAYSWTSSQAGDPMPAAGCSAVVTFTSPGPRTITLTGSNDCGAGSDTIQIVVQEQPSAGAGPVVSITSPTESAFLNPDLNVQLAGTATDPDGGMLSYEWVLTQGATETVLHTGNAASGAPIQFNWTPSDNVWFNCGGTGVTILLRVVDDDGNPAEDDVAPYVGFPPC